MSTEPHPTDEDDHCWNLACVHWFEDECSKRCETEAQVADQVMWLRRCHWSRRDEKTGKDRPWMARQISVSGHTL